MVFSMWQVVARILLTGLQRLLPRMALGLGCIAALLEKAFLLLGGNSHRLVPDRNQPRPKYHVKPHPSLAYKD